MGQVPALVEGQAQHGIAALKEGVVDGHVGLRTGMRLHVGVLGAEELLGAVASEVLGHVDHLAASVVAPARVALGILAGEDRPHCLEDGEARVVLGCDQLEVERVRSSSSRTTCAISGSSISSGAQRSMGSV